MSRNKYTYLYDVVTLKLTAEVYPLHAVMKA